MAKRGRPRKDDPRHTARKEAERLEEERLARLASGFNASGLPPGVNKTDTGMFQARITLEGKRINLGSFATAEEAGQVYASAKAAGFTCKDSPKKNVHKRGTGLRCSRLKPMTYHMLREPRCGSVLSAGVKALKKQGLQPRPNNMPYANPYGMPANGFAFAEPLARPLANVPLANVPLALAMPLQWQQPITLPSQPPCALSTTQPQSALLR